MYSKPEWYKITMLDFVNGKNGKHFYGPPRFKGSQSLLSSPSKDISPVTILSPSVLFQYGFQII